MEPSTEVVHHWHDPTQGQVTKAMYQYLADQGISQKEVSDIAAKKVNDILSGYVDRLINSGKFDELVLANVLSFLKNEKAVFERQGGYGLTNRIRDMIAKQLQETVLSEYKVEVTKR